DGDADRSAAAPAGNEEIGPGRAQRIAARRQDPGRVGADQRRHMRPGEPGAAAQLDEGQADRLGEADHLVPDADPSVMHRPDERLAAALAAPLFLALAHVSGLSKGGGRTASPANPPSPAEQALVRTASVI